MLILRLFNSTDTENPVDARVIGEEEVTIGRDQKADWTLADPDNQISRVHCTVQHWNGQLLLTDTSSNGVFLKGGKRITSHSPITLVVGQVFHFGSNYIEIALPLDGRADDRTIIGNAEQPGSQAMPTQTGSSRGENAESGGEADPLATDNGRLLSIFCDAAGIDISTLVEEDSAEIMERVGAIYREAVAGVSKLVNQRAVFRKSHVMDRTTIGSTENNPFKWIPEQNLASDLIKPSSRGYLNGGEALHRCFEDIDAHLSATTESIDGAAKGILEALSPVQIRENLENVFSLKSTPAKCWEEYVKLHELLSRDADRRKKAFGGLCDQTYSEFMGSAEQRQ